MSGAWPSAPTARPSRPDTAATSAAAGGGAVGRGARERLRDNPLPVTEGYVTSVAFSPDGKTLAAGYGAASAAAGWCCSTSISHPGGAMPEPNRQPQFHPGEWQENFPVSLIGKTFDGFWLLRARSRPPTSRLRLLPRLRLRGRIERMDPKTFRIRILSLDGGGIMGAFAASALVTVERSTRRKIG